MASSLHGREGRVSEKRGSVSTVIPPHTTAPRPPPALSAFRALPMRASPLTLTSASLYQSKRHRPDATVGPVVWTKPWGKHRGHSSHHLEQFARPTLAGGRARIRGAVTAPCTWRPKRLCPRALGGQGQRRPGLLPFWVSQVGNSAMMVQRPAAHATCGLCPSTDIPLPQSAEPTRAEQMTLSVLGKTSLQDHVARFIN